MRAQLTLNHLFYFNTKDSIWVRCSVPFHAILPIMKKILRVLLIILCIFILAAMSSASGRTLLRDLLPKAEHTDLFPTLSAKDTETSGDSEENTDGGISVQMEGGAEDAEGTDSAGAPDTDSSRETGTASEGAEEGQNSSASASLSRAVDASLYYYRAQLTGDTLSIYDALLACAQSEDPAAYDEEISIDLDPSEGDFHTAFSVAYNALLYDHPELFWVAVSGGSVQYSYHRVLLSSDTWQVSFQLTGDISGREAQTAAFSEAVDTFLSGIDLTQSKPQIALQIHDRLIALVTYDGETADASDRDLAHTAYGALVANSSGESSTAVCDGYAMAYEYLLQRAGIECIIVSGYAGETAETAGSHSWNLVQYDGEWYEVDCTWDDISVDEAAGAGTDYQDIAQEALSSSWYLARLHHFLFNVTTAEITNYTPGERYRYTNDRGWVSFIGSSVHIRHTTAESASTGDYMTPLAPTAYGTTYTYDALTNGTQ